MAYQVSIFLENKPGHFERVTGVLKANGINIRSMTLTHTVSGWGILSLLVNQPEKACEALTNAGLSAALRKVLAFGMEDHPGGLDDILMKVAQAGVNILNAYGRIISKNEQALLLIDVDDYDQALATLAAEDLYPLEDRLVYGN
ncbi:MAG: hypothetical protein AB7U05_00665 [Mangrovibacterium sp.]